jgi:hypothetical protein
MLDTLVEMLAALEPFLPLVLNTLPFLGTMLIVSQLMRRLVKPLVCKHKDRRGVIKSKLWRTVNSLMVLCPMLLGAGCGMLCIASGLPGPLVAYVGAGAVAQIAYEVFKTYAKSKGVKLPKAK